MLHPVGNLPASIYWRRRLLLIVAPVFLVIVLLWAFFGGGGRNRAASTAAPLGSHTTTQATVSGSTAPHSSTSAAPSSTAPSSASPTGTTQSPTTTQVDTCAKSDLQIEAATSSSQFQQQSRPTLFLQVTNTSHKPCRRDLADKQVQLRIQSGDARIWGSHDCQVQPGKDVVMLLPGIAVRRGIVWSGRTSAPGCKGTRLYPQPGTYELYAQLSGKQSKPVTFTLTASG